MLRTHEVLRAIAVLAVGSLGSPTPELEQRWTTTNCSTDLWNVSPPLNYSDEMYAGWRQLPTLTEVELYNGRRFNRTYAHHPQVVFFNETVFLIHTSGVVDEDSMGSEVWGSVSHDYGFTWTETTPYFPAALLPNQTNPETFEYWYVLRSATMLMVQVQSEYLAESLGWPHDSPITKDTKGVRCSDSTNFTVSKASR